MASGKTTPSATDAAVTPRDARALLTLVQEAAQAAADVIRTATPRRASLNWQEKGIADFVTEVDVAAEQAAMNVLRAAEPHATFIAEESSPHLPPPTSHLPLPSPISNLPSPLAVPSPLAFIIDPLDGTTNFLHGLPEYAVSIAAVVDGMLTAGVVLNVPRNECFTAAAGSGAWLGNQRLSVSTIENPQRALVGTGFPFKILSQIPTYLPQMARVMAATSGVRRPGSAAIDLASVAAGRLDGFWENFLSPWDVAAGILLIREAGGACTDASGQHSQVVFGPIVAGNPAIHAWLLRTLSEP